MITEERSRVCSQTEASNLLDSLTNLWQSLPDNIQLDCRYILTDTAISIEKEGC